MVAYYHVYLHSYFRYELCGWQKGGGAAYGWRETDCQSGCLEEFHLTIFNSGLQVVLCEQAVMIHAIESFVGIHKPIKHQAVGFGMGASPN